jgi:hypothetical protein
MMRRFTSATARLGILQPRNLGIIVRELRRPTVGSDAEHLQAATGWLHRAWDATGSAGVSAGYDLAAGWLPAYPETTGYIIGTMLHHADATGDARSRAMAVALGHWLLTVQDPEGWMSGGPHVAEGPYVFDTGQVLLGLLALVQETSDDAFVKGAESAARWLCRVQDRDGAWRQHALHGVPHAYYTRVSWALFRAGVVLDEPAFTEAARRTVSWVAGLQRDNGWIDHMNFDNGKDPLTHTIADTVEGLLEGAAVDGDERAWSIAVRTADALASAYRDVGSGAQAPRPHHLAATFNQGWRGTSRYACITGSIQMALCWQRIDARDGRRDLRELADDLIAGAKETQPLQSHVRDVVGGVPGSAPLWGSYGSFRYINWAVKFVADALLQRCAPPPRCRYS